MKKIVMFRCSKCIEEINAKKEAGETEVTLENGNIYKYDEIEFIEVQDSFKCGACGNDIPDVDLSTTVDDTPWKVYTQDGETETPEAGNNIYRMSLRGSFGTYEEAISAYENQFKVAGKQARINLKVPEFMIVVSSYNTEGVKSNPMHMIKPRIKPEGETK